MTNDTAKENEKTKKVIEPNPKLEGMLAEKRSDKNNWQVYADWLLEHGESWGEVIVKACSNKSSSEDRAPVEALLSDIDGASIEFDFGVVDTLTLAPEEDPEDEEGEGKMPRVLESVLQHPAGRLIRSLSLGLPPRVSGDIHWHFEDVIAAVGRAGPLPLLQVVDMTSRAEHMDQDSWRRIGDISVLWKAAPRLAELRMMGSSGSDGGVPIRFGSIDAPHLKKLIFISSGLSNVAPKEIAEGNLPALEHLELYFGRQDYGNNCTLSSLEGILTGASLPSLKNLGLMNSEWEADLIELIAGAAIIKRIQVLDLSKGVLFTEGAEALIANASSFRHLRSINLDENYIPEDLAARVLSALPQAQIGEQREVEDDYRFTAIGE